jgi:hypothetical protein
VAAINARIVFLDDEAFPGWARVVVRLAHGIEMVDGRHVLEVDSSA